MKKVFAILLALMLMQAPLSAQTIKVNDTDRNYIVYAPKDLGTGRPLLISCHGMNQDANYQKGMLQIESVADTAKFVTVFPEGLNKRWDIRGESDLQFMTALIDEMVEKYGIDRNRVYISGFSMGGMFTYHCMNHMADKFAAFAPISGYPMWGGTYTSSRPVPLIHTHGTTDDVVRFGGVAAIIEGWVKRNACKSEPAVIKTYRDASHITRHTWSGGENGVEVVLMEMANKGHWISNDNGVKTGDEIWKFCKRYSLK
ncbi:MAG: prolyl oligopeptidase family serine peptidase [Bacteroidaceae bacterium]|nr:prolyl oligopeptidase family serine peptidase [Bacteroidaceae bacterium]